MKALRILALMLAVGVFSICSIPVSVRKSIGENWMVRFSGTNIANQRYMLDTSNTFGGTHRADPFMCSVQVKFQFHY